jgi:hypothetical protein
MRTASLAEAWGGNAPREARTENPQRPYGRVRSGRSDLGGEPIGGPAQACMTAASNQGAVWKSLYGYGGAPTRSARGAGRCRGGRTGSMHATSRRGRGPSPQRQRRSTTAGQASSQPGRTATGTDPRSEGPTEASNAQLIIPAYSLVEPYETLIRCHRQRKQMKADLDIELQ